MKIGTLVIPNEKGQIVIPRQIRQALGIDQNVILNLIVRGNGVYMYPVEEVLTKDDSEESYLEVLRKTQGSWAGDDWEEIAKRRRRIELAAAKRRRRAW